MENEILWKWELLCGEFEQAWQNHLDYFAPLLNKLGNLEGRCESAPDLVLISHAEKAWNSWVDIQIKMKELVDNDGCSGQRHGVVSNLIFAKKLPVPGFNINHFVNRYHEHYRCIFIDTEMIHRVEDDTEFYEVLGYTEEWQNKNFVFEEYFWTAFRSPASTKHSECLPYLLMTYLYRVSCRYRELAGVEHDTIKGQCRFKNKKSDHPCLICHHF